MLHKRLDTDMNLLHTNTCWPRMSRGDNSYFILTQFLFQSDQSHKIDISDKIYQLIQIVMRYLNYTTKVFDKRVFIGVYIVVAWQMAYNIYLYVDQLSAGYDTRPIIEPHSYLVPPETLTVRNFSTMHYHPNNFNIGTAKINLK